MLADGGPDFFELRVAWVANGALPKASKARRNVQIPGEAPERLRVGRGSTEVGRRSAGIDAPTVEQGQPVAGIAECDCEVDGLIIGLGIGVAAL